MKAMRIHEFGGLDRMRLEEATVPEPGGGEVRIRVEAIGVNFADILMISGKYQLRPDLPFSPGFEVAGTIDAVGEDVTDWPVGTRIAATPWFGGYAEQVTVPVAGIFRLPPHIDAVTGANATVSFGTSYHALVDRGRLRPGEVLLVTGATGGVGSAAVQIGKILGATVIAAVGSESKVASARQLGADEVVTYSDEGPPIRDQLKAVVGPHGLDLVLDPVGGDVFDQAVRALGPGGRLLVVGFTAGRIPELPTNLVLVKETSVVGVFWGAFREREPDSVRSQFGVIWDWISDGRLDPPEPSVFPLASAAGVLSDLMNRRMIGKAVLLPESPPSGEDVK